MKQIFLVLALSGVFLGCSTTPSTDAGKPESIPQPSRSPNALSPLGAPPKAIAEPKIRVGLVSDQTTVTFERVEGGYLLVSDQGAFSLRRGFTLSSPLSAAPVTYGLQVAAAIDLTSAQALAERVAADTGRQGEILPMASGTFRVLAGEFADTNAANPLKEKLIAAGYPKEMFAVKRPSREKFDKFLTLVDDEGDRHRIESAALLVLTATKETIRIEGQPYRGAARIFINSRGLFNITNELPLEEYVRGVVPNEMGPKFFDELEGLKAQALAARTYAIRNMGQFANEGFDICATPSCQVYKGFATEDPLSDQAVRETAGQIITAEGKPIDSLYTSTCGGETSDVGTMFPGRNEPYLRRARCVEMEMTELRGSGDSTLLTENGAEARMFSQLSRRPVHPKSYSAQDVVGAVAEAARLAGVALKPSDPPASVRRGEVFSYLARVWNLEEMATTLTLPEDRHYFFPRSEKEQTPYLAAAFLIKFKLTPTQSIDRLDLEAPMPRDELYALLFSWLKKYGVVTEITGKAHSLNGRELVLKAEGKRTTLLLPENVVLFRRLGERYQEYSSAPVMLGDRLFVVSLTRGADLSDPHREMRQPAAGNVKAQVVAVIISANYDGAAFDRTSSFSNWTRSFRADELALSIAKRNPITTLVRLRPVTVDASRRVAELEVTAEGGRTFMLRGLPIRWSLGLPDNLFVITRSVDADGTDRYTFFGKGWGHGVGLCQVGAYGMAFRGWSAERIVKHYYKGVEITKAER